MVFLGFMQVRVSSSPVQTVVVMHLKLFRNPPNVRIITCALKQLKGATCKNLPPFKYI